MERGGGGGGGGGESVHNTVGVFDGLRKLKIFVLCSSLFNGDVKVFPP